MSEANEYGSVLDLSDIQTSRRGAEKTYEPGLLTLLSELATNPAVIITAWVVARADYDSSESFKNERQKRRAQVVSHVERLVELGTLPAGTKVGCDWHPELNVLQVQVKSA